MEKPVPPAAYSPEDLARRRRRSVVMAWCLVGMMVVFFVSTLVRLGASILDRSM
jgi:hypothetical protein